MDYLIQINILNRMKNTLGILVAAIFSLILFQNCQKSDFTVITGVVRDSITNQPLSGVVILTEKGTFTSASDGTFSIDGLRTGNTRVSIQYLDGYNPLTKNINITEGRVNKFDFVLSKITPPYIQTGLITAVSSSTINIAGSISLKSGLSVFNYGHCWSNGTTFPTLDNSIGRTSKGYASGQVAFSSNISGLSVDEVYYIRAYAETPNGIEYGNTVVYKMGNYSIDDGLLLYLPLSGNFTDASSNAIPYVWPWWNYPPFTTDRLGVPNSACRFDGSDNSPIFIYTINHFNALYDFSISFWFNKPTSWELSTQKLFNMGYMSGLKAYIHQGAAPNNLIFGLQSGGNNYEIVYPHYPSVDHWHHLVALRSGSEMKLYIDGTMVGSTSCDASVISNYYYQFWGFGYPDYKPYRGDLDELRLYDRALSSTEINYLATH